MPTINKPFLLKLFLAVAVFAGVLFGVHAYQFRRIPDALKRQADRAADAGKIDAATHYLRQYLEFKPDDVDSQEKLAELIRKRVSPRGQAELVFLYDRILRLDPERHATRRDALRLCIGMGRYSDAATHADALLKAFPTDRLAWEQLGVAQAGLNKPDEARASYEKAIAHAPHEMMPYRRLTQLLWKTLKQPAEAKKVVDRMVAALPMTPEVYLLRAEFLGFITDELPREAGAFTNQAIADLNRVFELDPENADAALHLSRILQQGRDVPGANVILRDAVALYPRDVRLIRGLAWMELVRGNVPAATAVLEEGVKNIPDGFDLVVSLADVLIQQGDTTRTTEMLTRLEARIPSLRNPDTKRIATLQAKYLKARLAIRQAKWTEAVALLEALRGEITNLPALDAQLNMLLAGCFQKLGDTDAEEKTYKRVVSAEPGNVAARVGLSAVLQNAGRFDEASRELETAANSGYAPGAVSAQFIRLRARLLQLSNGTPEQWRKLEEYVTVAAAKFGPVSAEPVVLLSDVLAARGKHTDAAALLRKETGRRPGDARLWAMLAERMSDALGTPAGLAIIDEAQAAAGDGPELRLARAALSAREPGRTRPIHQLGDRIESWSEADQLRLLYGLAEVYDELGDAVGAVGTLRKIAARRPTDTAVWLRLHERALSAKDAAATKDARTALANLEGETGPGVAICDARTSDPSAAQRLKAAFGTSPTRADACLALAAVCGDTTEANRLIERAATLEPTRTESLTAHLAALCRSDAGRAAKLVARLAGDSRLSHDSFRRVIDGAILLQPNSATQLMTWCKPLAEREPGGLGWVASHAGSDAEAILTAATASPMATADDWLRLARQQFHQGKKDAAAKTLADARGKLRTSAFFALAATVQDMPEGKDWSPTTADAPEKRALAQARLAVKLSRNDNAGATKLLEEYTADASIRKFDLGWGQRNLAMLYAVNGKPEDRQKAMGLIAAAAQTGTTEAELRATASVLTTLARYLEGDDRRKVMTYAAANLEAVHKASGSPRDLFNLVQLYRAAGDAEKSQACLQKLLDADGNNIYYLTAALEVICKMNDFKRAEAFASRLRSVYPGEFRAVAAVARYECLAGRPERALALAEQYSRVADPSAGDYLARSARVAELLDELLRYPMVRRSPAAKAMTDAAVERYAALVPNRPEAAVGIAGVLASQDRTADAFARIELYAKFLPNRVRVMAGLAALRGGSATERHFATVREWLDASAKDEGNSVSFLLNEAEFFTLQSATDKAIAAYETVLKRDPRNVVALNNLAWMLSADPAGAKRSVELIAQATREIGLTGELLDTRARACITLKLFPQAESDSNEALKMDRTPLRLFHMALVLTGRTPADAAAAAKAFAEARTKGLDAKAIHPADLPAFKALDAGMPK
jgi:tetratricopeptide (TPR) repeat protein